MFDEVDQRALSRWQIAFVRLDTDHWEWRRAAMLLEAAGGHRSATAEWTVYEFLTPAARDDALDLVRSRFGWTIATPFDGRSWSPGWDTESRGGRAVLMGSSCPSGQHADLERTE